MLSSTDQKEKGHQRENNFRLVRGGSTHTQIQEEQTSLLAAWPCTEIGVCAHATGSVTGNIWCNWTAKTPDSDI